jgi:hypothetical protein
MNLLLEYIRYVEEARASQGAPGWPGVLTIKSRDTMKRNTRKRRNAWIIAVTVAMLATSGTGKIFGVELIAEQLNKVGVGKFMLILGIVELLLAVLFIFPKTIKVSFILLSCYFSGAIATEVSHGGNFIIPFIFLAVVWIASLLREKSILKLAADNNRLDQNPWNVNWMLVE